jgi:hypothetical protein
VHNDLDSVFIGIGTGHVGVGIHIRGRMVGGGMVGSRGGVVGAVAMGMAQQVGRHCACAQE